MNNNLVEVRIPTYKRPEWLAHAIRSLLSQDAPDWKAVVFDDSPGHEGENVVRSFNDARLIYRPNEKNLGAARNLNQCFRNTPYVDGRYAFVLEDDNWLLPGFISSNLAAIEKSGVSFVHCNQEIWTREGDMIAKTESTTLGNRYFRERMTSMQLHAHILFWTGISNGALFFRTGTRSNLEVDSPESDPGLQEYLRCAAIGEDSIFLNEPKAVFASMPTRDTARRHTDPKYFSAFVRELQRRILNHHGSAILDEANEIQKHLHGNNGYVSQILANVNALGASQYLKNPKLLKFLGTGISKSLIYRSKVNANLFWK